MSQIVLDKLAGLGPEMALVAGACVCLFLGLARSAQVRRLAAMVAGVALAAAGVMVLAEYLAMTDAQTLAAGPAGVATNHLFAMYVKAAVAVVGLMLLLVAANVPDQWHGGADDGESADGAFDPAHAMRGEFFAFFLFSLTGVMLCAGASDLVWLFLALELTSLPTYVMVATSANRLSAQEAGVKYFFLGAMAAAVFLYGFTLIYGATGTTDLVQVRQFVTDSLAAGRGVPVLLIVGLVLSIVGVSFKIAAVPMHFYAADVYQGAATPVTAFLAFVPKTAGFVSIILLLGTIASTGRTFEPVTWVIWLVAALTMTIGNVLSLLQRSVKRVLAYSSIAHSGYMLVGLVGVPVATASGGGPIESGVAAVLFYLVAYGVGNLGAFAVLACLQARGQEADTFDDISGLSKRHPALAAVMLVSVLSLVGLPPMIGFLGKVYLFGAALSQSANYPQFVWLVVIAVINSAISAVYYLRIAGVCYFGESADDVATIAPPARRVGGAAAALAAIVLGVTGGWLVHAAGLATGSVAPARPILTKHPAVHAEPAPRADTTPPDAHTSSTVTPVEF